MDLLVKYGDKLTADDHFDKADYVMENNAEQLVSVSTAGQVLTGILALIISVAAGFIG